MSGAENSELEAHGTKIKFFCVASQFKYTSSKSRKMHTAQSMLKSAMTLCISVHMAQCHPQAWS